MNQQTTRQETRIPLLHGWLSSIALHGLMLLSVFPLFRQSPLTVHNEPFHWDVALVSSTQTAGETVQASNATEPVVSKSRTPAPIPVRAVRPIRHATPSAERLVPIEPQAAEPIAPTSQPSIASSAATPKKPATASISDQQTPNQPQVSEPPLQPTEPPISSTTPAAAPLETAAAGEGSTPIPEAAQPTPLPATTSDVAAVSAIRPDYGWLQQAIFRRLEELKRSSRPLLDQSQPFKVTVKAVVSREGTLLDSVVVKSSGLDRIDQEAIALVQRAFPLQLDRSLDRGQIVMRIPITYSQE